MLVYLDNIPLAYPTPSLTKPKFTLRKKDETGETAFSFSGDMTFEGSDYDYIYNKLVTDPNAIINQVELKFVDDCCTVPKVYLFWIKPESLKWCEGSCSITGAAVEATLSQEQLTCLKNTLIYDDWNGFKSMAHPRMSYCNELRPDWLHDVLIILTIATWTSFLAYGPMLIVVATTIMTINLVIQAINALGGNIDEIDLDDDPSTNALQEMNNWVNKLLGNSFGCGRKHPSPLVRDYIQNVCGKCGIGFSSSIVNDPASDYYNLVYHNAPVNKGIDPSDSTTYWIEENKPLLNGTKFLNQIKLPFNADWKIQNSVLHLERRDFFIPSTPWLDLTTLPEKQIVKICWNWTKKDRYSYGNFYYQKDGVNWVGSEAIDRWGDIVEWNSPYSVLQKDEFLPPIPFAACRFRDDGIDGDVLTKYEDLPTISGLIGPYKRSIILNSHTCFTPMLLIWDGQDRANAKVNNQSAFFPALAGINEFFNYPMWIKAGYPGNLYDRFWYIENPRYSNWKGFDFTAEIIFTCTEINALNLDGMVKTSRGLGKVDSVDVDYTTNTMIIKGTV